MTFEQLRKSQRSLDWSQEKDLHSKQFFLPLPVSKAFWIQMGVGMRLRDLLDVWFFKLCPFCQFGTWVTVCHPVAFKGSHLPKPSRPVVEN